jgi:hypothetical protein
MAKKNNKPGETPQETAGAANTEQPLPIVQNPDESAGAAAGDGAGTATGTEPQNDAGAPVVTEQPGATTQAAGAAEGKTKKTTEPKVSDAVVKIGKFLLKSNPEMSVVYMTADGSGFYEKNDAELHASNLTNKAVTPVKSS